MKKYWILIICFLALMVIIVLSGLTIRNLGSYYNSGVGKPTLFSGTELNNPEGVKIKTSPSSANKLIVYNNADTKLVCSTTSEYGEGVVIRYQFGYAEEANGEVTWLGSESENNLITISKNEYKGERHYTCRVKAVYNDDQTDAVEATSRLGIIYSNARIDFNANGGEINSGNANVLYVEYGATGFVSSRYGDINNTLTAPKATKSGLVFDGWYTSASGGNKVIDKNGNIELNVSPWTTADGKWRLISGADTAATNTLYAQYVESQIEPPATPTISGGANKVYNYEDTTLTCTTTTTYNDGTVIYYDFGYSDPKDGSVTWNNTPSTTNTKIIDKNNYLGSRNYMCKIYAQKGDLTTNPLQSNQVEVSYGNVAVDFIAKSGTLNGVGLLYVAYGKSAVYAEGDKTTTTTIPTASKSGNTFEGWFTSESGGSKVVDASGNIMASVTGWTNASKQWILNNVSSNYNLYAHFKENAPVAGEDYKVNNYTMDIQNHIIDKVSIKTSLTDYRNNFVLSTGYTISIDLGGKNYIYTGSVVKVLYNGNVVDTYTNIIRGDINGDGQLSPLDYVKVKNHILGTNLINDNIFAKAADANSDSNISPLDYVRIKNIIMGN